MGRYYAGAVAGLAPGILALCSFSCGVRTESPRPVGTPLTIAAPLGLPPVPIPLDNPPTVEAAAFGRALFLSPVLSADGRISCSTCHDPDLAFTDGRAVSIGAGGKAGVRNSPTLLNAAYNKTQFWDGRTATLEAQASGPMLNSLEMAHTLEGVERQAAADPELRKLSERAFGPGPITMAKISNALATFERTLVGGNSPFDKFFYGGDKKAMSVAAQRGLAVFRERDKGNCTVCHTITETHALFTDHKFHNLGVGLDARGELTDMGHKNGAFRTPTLRNVGRTAPYMHDGSLKTLKEVVDFYVGGGSANPYLDKEIKPLSHLTKQEREDLVAFLESLNGEGQEPAPAGVVRGTVRFTGKTPPKKAISMDAEEACGKLHRGPVYEQAVVTGKAGALANVFVYIKTGLEGKTFAPPKDVVVLDQRGCQFVPRVVAMQAGQTLAVRNSDPVSHNIHPRPANNREWNQQQSPGAPDLERRFARGEVMIPVKCNVHAWMKSWIGVMEHPYFAVTGPDGAFELRNLPPGEYTVAAWHEQLGEQLQRVTVSPKSERIEFRYR